MTEDEARELHALFVETLGNHIRKLNGQCYCGYLTLDTWDARQHLADVLVEAQLRNSQ